MALNPTQDAHLHNLKVDFVAELDAKYRKGAAEHDGNLTDMAELALVQNMIDEAVDQYVYAKTLQRRMLDRITAKVQSSQLP